jgi:catechol 2,3-dioxygenase-like lactoylglutathione lyase family enzyme
MKTLRHAGIVVKNMNRSLRFYKGLLGLKVVSDNLEFGDYLDNMLNLPKIKVRTVKLSCDNGKSLIELLNFSSPPVKTRKTFPTSLGPTHVAFEVDDLNVLYKRLKRARVRFNSTPQDSPDKRAKVTFCMDPDGSLIELVEIIKQ